MDWNTELSIIGGIFIAIVLGGIIGLERELAKKPAGLRTHMLVSGASAFLVALSELIVLSFTTTISARVIGTDPVRIIQSIVIGLSFLGAGTIIQREQEERIEGLTTAASMLFTSAIGISVALGKLYVAVGVTLLVLVVNFCLRYVETWLKTKPH